MDDKSTNQMNFNQSSLKSAIIFTDGASRGNPGPGGFGAIIIFHDDGKAKVVELGGRESQTTNNRMELRAAIEALVFLNERDQKENVTVYTDSRYVVNGVTSWISGWMRNGWKTQTNQAVLNQDLWEELSRNVGDRQIEWKYIGGHSGIPGNERCDQIATSFADLPDSAEKHAEEKGRVTLYKGNLEGYPVQNIFELSHKTPKKSASKSKSKPYSYVSMVEGKIMIHKTWEECEERVRGVSGAKYKKTTSKSEEEELIAKWRAADS